MNILKWFINLFKRKKHSCDNTKDSWSLEEFSKLHGEMQFIEIIGQCRFVKRNTVTTVYMSNAIKNYKSSDIAKNKDRLFIKRFKDTGNYCLCLKWEEVDLGV